MQLDFVPSMFLLQLPSGGHKQSHKALSIHLINAAWMCILVYWKTATVPAMGEWLKKIHKVCEMEKVVHTAQDLFGKFNETWTTWLSYREQIQN